MERVKKGEKYWSITLDYGGVRYWENTESDVPENYRNWETNNYFNTKEEAEDVARRFRAVLKGADVIEMPKYEDELNAAINVYHQKEYSEGEYCHEQSFAWGFQEGVDWLKSKIIK